MTYVSLPCALNSRTRERKGCELLPMRLIFTSEL